MWQLTRQPWITPSLFDGKPDWVIDEWTYAEFTKDNRTELERHWDTWITEQDLRAIAGAGLNTVRIPVGCECDMGARSAQRAGQQVACMLVRLFRHPLESGDGGFEDLPVMGRMAGHPKLVSATCAAMGGMVAIGFGSWRDNRDCLSRYPQIATAPARSDRPIIATHPCTPNLTTSPGLTSRSPHAHAPSCDDEPR